MAFRKDDSLCDLVSAVLEELAANGTLRSASIGWFGSDLTGLKGKTGAADEYRADNTARTLIVGINTDNKPLGYMSGDEIVGFDVDLASYICGYLGWSMVLRSVSADDVDVQLASGNVDCVMGVPETQKVSTLSYSPEYLTGKYLLISTVGGVSTKAGMRGKILGVATADIPVLQEDTSFLESLDKIIYQTGTDGLFTALANGHVDAILVSGVVASYYTGG